MPHPKMVITDLNAKSLASLMQFVRSSRMGKVKRHGRKGHRTYHIEPRNPQEMPAHTRALVEMGIHLDTEASYQNR